MSSLRSLLTRTEPRDLFDIHYILVHQMVDVEQVVFGMTAKFESKGLAISGLKTVLSKRQATFTQLWRGRLDGQMPEVPPLESVLRETNRFLQRNF